MVMLSEVDQGVLNRLSKRYEAQFSTFVTPTEVGVFRITGNRDQSFDFFKSLVYLLERMRHQTVDLTPEPRKFRRDIRLGFSRERLRDSECRRKLQNITNTIIKIVPGAGNTGSFDEVATSHFRLDLLLFVPC